MSIGVCRVQKISGAGNITGCQIHNRREREHSNTNPDIDFTQSMNNFSLLDKTNKPYNLLIDERLKVAYKGKRAIRKDAVKLCEMLFTSDTQFFKNLSPKETKQYFQDCYNFACERYGKENIISAVVHFDETTPHLHLDFVPLTSDGRLSAKEILGVKADLQKLQDDFYNQVSSKYGLERGNRADLENNEPTKKHLTTQEYKLKTTKDKLQQAQSELIKTEQQIKQSSDTLETLKGRILTQEQVNALNGKKSLTGALKGISYEEYLSLKETASYVDTKNNTINDLKQEKNALVKEIKRLNSEIQNMISQQKTELLCESDRVRKEVEKEYQNYVFFKIPLSFDIENLTHNICCAFIKDYKKGCYILKCPYSESELLEDYIQNLELEQDIQNNLSL